MTRIAPFLLLSSCAGASVQSPVSATGASVQRQVGPTRITALRTGFVQVRPTHRELSGWEWSRTAKIVLESEWSEWMPIWVYLVEHPTRTILVDTGLGPNHQGGLGSDAGTRWFYRENLRFVLPEDEQLASHLERHSVAPDSVDTVVLTHLHGDHTGNLHLFPSAEIITGAGNWPGHPGAVVDRHLSPTLIPDGPAGPGPALTSDDAVRIFRLPGHTPGHLGLSVTAGDERWLICGDATFNEDQTQRGAVSGISSSIEDAKTTQHFLGTLRDRLLPAHDPKIVERIKQ
ncbi:MAG: N-acyl homoserine lactonase family protein [Myxococcota bacterium]